eukprot:4729927-Amphidinium_carterae.3
MDMLFGDQVQHLAILLLCSKLAHRVQGKFILDPKFQVGSDTARWYDSRLQKVWNAAHVQCKSAFVKHPQGHVVVVAQCEVQFEWYFLRDHPVGSEDSKAEIVPKPRPMPVPQRPPGLWAKGSHSKGTFGYEARVDADV